MTTSSESALSTNDQRSVGCAGCGDCCERVVPTFIVGGLSAMQSEPHGTRVRVSDGDRERWPEETKGHTYWKNSTRAGRWRRDLAFYARWFRPTGEVQRQGAVVKQVFTCLAFDPVERRCTQHANRPEMCSLYPEYGHGVGGFKYVREPHCSYNWDLPVDERPDMKGRLIPLEVL